MGSILYDNETRASWKLYRVSSIQFIRSYAVQRHSCLEATCEPVYRDAETDHFIVPADQRVSDSKVIKTTALQGYTLAEYHEGLEKVPTDFFGHGSNNTLHTSATSSCPVTPSCFLERFIPTFALSLVTGFLIWPVVLFSSCTVGLPILGQDDSNQTHPPPPQKT
jgi:hypothetical protein